MTKADIEAEMRAWLQTLPRPVTMASINNALKLVPREICMQWQSVVEEGLNMLGWFLNQLPTVNTDPSLDNIKSVANMSGEQIAQALEAMRHAADIVKAQQIERTNAEREATKAAEARTRAEDAATRANEARAKAEAERAKAEAAEERKLRAAVALEREKKKRTASPTRDNHRTKRPRTAEVAPPLTAAEVERTVRELAAEHALRFGRRIVSLELVDAAAASESEGGGAPPLHDRLRTLAKRFADLRTAKDPLLHGLSLWHATPSAALARRGVGGFTMIVCRDADAPHADALARLSEEGLIARRADPAVAAPAQAPAPTPMTTATATATPPTTDAIAAPPYYGRDAVLGDIDHLVRCGALRPAAAAVLKGDAALPRFAAGGTAGAAPADRWPRGQQPLLLELRVLRTLLGLGDVDLPARDNGVLSSLAQRLPEWKNDWLHRSVSPTTGNARPLRYAGRDCAGHLLRAAEVLAAVRHNCGGAAGAAILEAIHVYARGGGP